MQNRLQNTTTRLNGVFSDLVLVVKANELFTNTHVENIEHLNLLVGKTAPNVKIVVKLGKY